VKRKTVMRSAVGEGGERGEGWAHHGNLLWEEESSVQKGPRRRPLLKKRLKIARVWRNVEVGQWVNLPTVEPSPKTRLLLRPTKGGRREGENREFKHLLRSLGRPEKDCYRGEFCLNAAQTNFQNTRGVVENCHSGL